MFRPNFTIPLPRIAGNVGFTGGAGVIMDVNTGEVVAMVSYPEYDSQF